MELTKQIKEKWDSWEGLSSSFIKGIAIITMLIDHFGAGILGRYLDRAGIWEIYSYTDVGEVNAWLTQNGRLYFAYKAMRAIGRLAFPIFCFFLVEGFKHTRNRWKYLGRLAAFSLISEIPFDLLFNEAALEFQSQNVYFTLTIGLLVLIGFDTIGHRIQNKMSAYLLDGAVLVAGCIAAYILKSDYDFLGIMCIAVIYLFSGMRSTQLIMGAISFGWELPVAPLAFGLLALYKNKRGKNMKYFFYIFYPAHILLLYWIAYLLGIQGFRSM